MMPSLSRWQLMADDQRADFIRAHPHLAYSEIAATLGTTKGAVSGAAFRAGLKRPRNVAMSSKPLKPKHKPKAVKSASAPVALAPVSLSPTEVVAPAPPAGHRRVELLSTKARHCRWPTWNGKPRFRVADQSGAPVCGRPATVGSYCADCAEKAFQPYVRPSRKPRDPARAYRPVNSVLEDC